MNLVLHHPLQAAPCLQGKVFNVTPQPNPERAAEPHASKHLEPHRHHLSHATSAISSRSPCCKAPAARSPLSACAQCINVRWRTAQLPSQSQACSTAWMHAHVPILEAQGSFAHGPPTCEPAALIQGHEHHQALRPLIAARQTQYAAALCRDRDFVWAAASPELLSNARYRCAWEKPGAGGTRVSREMAAAQGTQTSDPCLHPGAAQDALASCGQCSSSI